MFKIPRLNQYCLLVVFLLVGATFLSFPELFSKTFSIKQSAFVVHAQATNLTPTPVPLSAECSLRCDTDGNGVITKSDLVQYGNDPNEQGRILYCTQQCPFDGLPPLTPPARTTGTVTPVNRPGVVGDCSGVTQGVPDGMVDMKDIEQFRRELNKETLNGAPTMACDLDKNNTVDIIDFTNYIRVGFSAQTQQNPTVVPTTTATVSPVSTTPVPTAIPTPISSTDAVITPLPTP